MRHHRFDELLSRLTSGMVCSGTKLGILIRQCKVQVSNVLKVMRIGSFVDSAVTARFCDRVRCLIFEQMISKTALSCTRLCIVSRYSGKSSHVLLERDDEEKKKRSPTVPVALFLLVLHCTLLSFFLFPLTMTEPTQHGYVMV